MSSPVLVMAAFVVGLAVPASANVYASSLQVTGDKSFSYTLNENASTNVQMQVWQVGGGMVYSQDLGAQTKGVQNWTWSGAGAVAGNSYKVKIVATGTNQTRFAKISTDSNTAMCYWLPTGVSVNKDQNSAEFGKIFISNGQAGTDHLGTYTGDGFFRVNADYTADIFGNGGRGWGGTTETHNLRSTVGPDGHLYFCDAWDDTVWELNDDLSTVTQLIDLSNKSNGSTQWCSAIVVEGTQAEGNRKIYVCDSNYDDTTHKGLMMYDLGANATATHNDHGTQYIGPGYFNYFPVDVDRDAAGNWYMNNYRSSTTQAPFLMKFNDSASLPINTAAWEAPKSYTYCDSVAVDDKDGWVAGITYTNGMTYVFNKETGTSSAASTAAITQTTSRSTQPATSLSATTTMST